MFETSSLQSRLLFVCAAVMLSIMGSDAAVASLQNNQVDAGVRHIVRRRPYTQHRPLFSGLPSLQTGVNSETEKSGNYGGASSIIYQSNPPRFTESSFSYINSPENKPFRAGTTSVPSGMSPASSYRPLSYNSYPVINKKTSSKEAASPFQQSSSPPEGWDAKEAHRSYIKESVPKNDSPSLFPSQTSRYRSSSRLTSRRLYSGYKETNEPSSAGVQRSSGILLSKYFSPASQTAPRAPSFSSSSVIKRIPSPEKLTPSITDFSQGLHSASGSETPRLKKTKSYLFEDSQPAFGGHETVQTVRDEGPHKQRASEVTSGFSSYVKQLQRKDPTKNIPHLSDNANLLHHNEAHYGARTDGFARYRHTARLSARGKDGILGSNYAAGSSKSGVSSISDATTRGSTHASTPGQAMKNPYGFRSLGNSKWRAAKEPIPSSSGSNERTSSGRSSFDEGKGSTITNMNLPLPPKYSFGWGKASAVWAKPERTPTEYSAPSPGTHQDLTSGFKEARPRIPDSNPDHRRLGTHKRIYGFKAFGPRSLEAAKTPVSEPEESAKVQQGLEGFRFVGSPQVWQPKISRINTTSRTEPGSEDHKPLLKTAGSAESVSKVTPDEYKKKDKIDMLLVFQSIQNRSQNADDEAHKENPKSHRISSAYFRSAGKPDSESSPKSEPGTPDKTELFTKMASLFNRSTSSTARGQAKTLNESAPINDTGKEVTVGVVALASADVLGSASSSGDTATTQTPTTPADKGDFPNASAAAEQEEGARNLTLNSEEAVRSGDNTSRGPEEVEENKMAVGSEEVDYDAETSDFLLGNEGSGSGGFDVSDVLSTAATKSQGLSEDLLELEYLRISTGNISFKSMTHTEP
ncbi:hypothetical protein VZT92_017134 [Zoarces viviparus]|uniref:Uncharacterized protein n=1 Tax=Zoarces viviparus TaxID=48416 RepID=A0AAW1EPT9_ZOAVI